MSRVVKFVPRKGPTKLINRLAIHSEDVHIYIQIVHDIAYCYGGSSIDRTARCQGFQRTISNDNL